MSRRTKRKVPTWTDAELKEAAKRAARGPIKTASMSDPEFAAARERFNAATGGEPRPIDSHADAHDESAALVFKLDVQRTKMMEIIQRIPNHDDMVDAGFLLGEVLDTALRLGAVKFTSDKRVALDVSRKNRSAAKAGGEKRRAEADEMWRTHALELAQEAQRADSKLVNQRVLIEEIRSRWRLKGCHPPAFDTLIKFVRAKQKSGNLRGRKG